MAVRNFEEYRAEVLEQLGATAEDLRNEPSWRAKVLEALGAEYTEEDTRNFERYRLKVLENLSGGGGGGGSSDFSTAEVTISTTEDVIIVQGCITVDEEGFVASVPNISVHSDTPSTVKFILYKGTAFATIDNGDLYNIETTGDIVNDDGDLYITGDCTITIS